MTAAVKDISQRHVAILVGACDELVRRRELVKTYQTNREIKTWSAYFVLKSESSSGFIKNWPRQSQHLQYVLKANDNTIRTRIKEMAKLGLLTTTTKNDLQLCSFKDAAEILGIEFYGTYKVLYDLTNENCQHFQYIIRAEEFRSNQDLQLDALTFKLNKNLSLSRQLQAEMCALGASAKKLQTSRSYLQEQLLRLQMLAFKEGSEIYSEIMSLRADISRGIRGITAAHEYKSERSAVYLKKRMREVGALTIQKPDDIISKVRSRLYVAGKDGYRWLPDQKATSLRLCDQFTFSHVIEKQKSNNEAKKTAAA